MNKRTSVSFFSLALFFLLITCKKEYSYEGGPLEGTSIYTFVAAGTDCSGSIVNGSYTVNSPLTSFNTLQLLVDVTTPGTYIVSTGSVDGITFTASGSFSDTGRQIMILTGEGTPVSDGIFAFTTPGLQSCGFSVAVAKAAVSMASYTLDGSQNSCTNYLQSGTYTSYVTLQGSNTVSLHVNVTKIGVYTISTDTLDGIYFSSSGTFTALGDQLVTLTGTGTPLYARDLVFTPLGDSSACSFGLTVLNPQPLATYVLESGSGTNSNPCVYKVIGNYLNSTPLNSADTVRIHVYVATVGNFTIATDLVNGMIFTYSGTFTYTGAQFVYLTGSGTPVNPGNYTFTPQIVGPHPLGGESCSFVVNVQ